MSMTALAVMAISFGAPFDDYESFLPFRNGRTCGEQIQPMRAMLEAEGMVVVMIRCHDVIAPLDATNDR